MKEKNEGQMQENKHGGEEQNDSQTQMKKEIQMLQLVTKYLRDLGMPAHLKGYYYTRDAIVMTTNSPEKVHSITKELYPDVAKKHKTTSAQVERAMRTAVQTAWKRADPDAVKEIFGYSNTKRKKPTNSEFIAQIADDIRIKHQI